MNIREQLDAAAAERIIIIDGAMGSMIQSFKLTEADFRGSRFADHKIPLLGCNDLLCITSPWVISGIHEAYLRSGADIIETCSLNATSVSLADFGIGSLAYEISAAAASLARKSADKFSIPEKPRFVAGSIGPTAKSASIFPDINNPSKRAVTWDELEAAYYDNVRGLLDGGADILLIETAVDTLNTKAAIAAIARVLEERRKGAGTKDVPLIISATVSEGGRLLSGQTVEAFCVSVLHAKPWAVGLNCSFGAERLKPYAANLAAFAPCFISVYPNAGFPDSSGVYGENPVFMADCLEEYMAEGIVNVVGGCCGSTPSHIAVIAERAKSYKPRKIPAKQAGLFLSGLEPLRINGSAEPAADKSRKRSFTIIGERTNAAGSRKFLRLIKDEKYNEALDIARDMIGAGAEMIDVCMDDALLDPEKAMETFLGLASQDPEIARVPVMIDSSRWEVIETALKCIQGKCLINSISLKEGEEEFLRRAALARRYGAAVVVMLFDEKGRAADYERKIETARRSWDLLINNGFPAGDVVFDPNVLAIATGIPEHDRYALDFIRACEWIRKNCPGAQISGGISNLSFSFRGNNAVREAMHAVFLKHALAAGLSMAIVNPGGLLSCDETDPALRKAAGDVILRRNEGKDPSGRLLSLAEKMQDKSGAGKKINRNETIATVREMEKKAREIPLLTGGAAASLAHTGLRIAPEYSGPVVYVPDASQSAEVVQSFFSDTEKNVFLEKLETAYQNAAMQHEKGKHYIGLLPLEKARENKIPMVFDIPAEPKIKDVIELKNYPIDRVIPHIDWSSFLQTWDLAEKTYPTAYTAENMEKRQKARDKLINDAKDLLKKITGEKILELRGAVGFFPALSDGDDIVIYGSGGLEISRFCFPRNQEKKRVGGPNACLADFIMPGEKAGNGTDWIGFFALSAGFGLSEALKEYREKNDGYLSILLASLTNTLTEAFSEEIHLRVRREWWGYAPNEILSTEEILTGKFRGIRPAFGYPACPDHWCKKTAFDLLDAEKRCGLSLTETAMIIPAASVCGMYIAAPGSYYFGVGRLNDDQIDDWAKRKKISRREAEKRLGQNL
ncbi:MAG: homocysteine S-methyltransferase family protein [Treponema sp.]|nr:homocysteine S-methyltransferase family protein [Treponema sp.]